MFYLAAARTPTPTSPTSEQQQHPLQLFQKVDANNNANNNSHCNTVFNSNRLSRGTRHALKMGVQKQLQHLLSLRDSSSPNTAAAATGGVSGAASSTAAAAAATSFRRGTAATAGPTASSWWYGIE